MNPNKNKSVNALAKKAMKEAVAEVIKDHARTGHAIYVWKNGKVVRIPAKALLRRKK